MQAVAKVLGSHAGRIEALHLVEAGKHLVDGRRGRSLRAPTLDRTFGVDSLTVAARIRAATVRARTVGPVGGRCPV